MAACRKNNRYAQRELYERFAHQMKGVCLRYAQNEDDAEDILQESFIKIFRNIDSYSNSGALGGWIRRIVVNSAIEFYRKTQTRQKHYDQFETLSSANEALDAFESMNLDAIMAKIQQLPTGYRVIFNLYIIEGYNHREIAEKLNISEGTSKSQLSRAKRILQDLILKEEENEKKRLRHAK